MQGQNQAPSSLFGRLASNFKNSKAFFFAKKHWQNVNPNNTLVLIAVVIFVVLTPILTKIRRSASINDYSAKSLQTWQETEFRQKMILIDSSGAVVPFLKQMQDGVPFSQEGVTVKFGGTYLSIAVPDSSGSLQLNRFWLPAILFALGLDSSDYFPVIMSERLKISGDGFATGGTPGPVTAYACVEERGVYILLLKPDSKDGTLLSLGIDRESGKVLGADAFRIIEGLESGFFQNVLLSN